MADILTFNQYAGKPDPEGMDRPELLDYLAWVRERIALLDQQEPEDMASPEYELWGGRHEELEDLADEIQDLMDELEDPHG